MQDTIKDKTWETVIDFTDLSENGVPIEEIVQALGKN